MFQECAYMIPPEVMHVLCDIHKPLLRSDKHPLPQKYIPPRIISSVYQLNYLSFSTFFLKTFYTDELDSCIFSKFIYARSDHTLSGLSIKHLTD